MLQFICYMTLIFIQHSTLAFILEGSSNSFVKYPKWYHSFEDEISFEFKTEQRDGLILYTDDGGISNFYEMSLYRGQFRVRFKIGSAGSKRAHSVTHMQINHTVSDGKWHKVKFFQFWENVQLNVDNKRSSIKLFQRDFRFGSYETNSPIFVGGLPEDIHDKDLSSPLAKHLRHLAASFRNFIYRTLPQGVTAPHILEMHGSRITDDQYCTQEDYCKNGGICYSTNSGPKCNCEYVDFKGKKCEKEDTKPLAASFYGSEFISYDFVANTNGFLYNEEQLELGFRTKLANALLFYSANKQDYLHITLSYGALITTSMVGGSKRELKVEPFTVTPTVSSDQLYYNDDRWHYLTLHRRLDTRSTGLVSLSLSMSVDGMDSDVKQTINDDYSFLSNSLAYVGGRPINGDHIYVQSSLPNFVGCMSKIRYRADGRKLDLLHLAHQGSESMVKPHGSLAFQCRPMSSSPEPISILSPDAFIKLQSWQAAKSGTLSFQFRTNEPDGLIMFNTATGGNSSSDFFAFELINNDLFFAINLGSGTMRLHTKTKQSITDGLEWHKVTLIRESRSGTVIVDGVQYDFSTPGSANKLDLGGHLYIGGWDWSHPTSLSAMPSSVWTASLRKGFVGCISSLNLNGVSTDLITSASNAKSSSIRIGCSTTIPQCPSAPCLHKSKCTEGWNRFICDCSTTATVGQMCDEAPVSIQFREVGQHMHLSLPFTLQSEAEELQIKFITSKPSGILVATSCRFCPDRYELSLNNGQLEILLTLGDSIHNWVFTGGLANNNWHHVTVQRRGQTLYVSIDGAKAVRHGLPKSQLTLRYDTFWAGRVGTTDMVHSKVRRDGPESIVRSSRTLGARPGPDPHLGPSFVGDMSAFKFNGLRLFALAAREDSGELIFSSGVNITAQFGAHRTVQENPITFTSRDSYAIIGDDLFKHSPLLHIFFQFRTLETEGLLLYSQGLDRDFIAIELQAGKLIYIFNSGEGSKRIEANTGYSLNDFKWHFVLIYQKTAEEHLVVVDNVTADLKVLGNNHQLNLRGVVYIGGLEQHTYAILPQQIKSRHGFRGCIATVEISQIRVDLLNEVQRQNGLVKGCHGPTVLCHAESCANQGVCIQHWTNYECDCSMTTYLGNTCNQKSVTYSFGPEPGGLLVYNFPDRTSTESDTLVVGIETNKSPAVVVRVESKSPDDFLLLQIDEDGHAVVVYNLGTENHVIGDVSRRVDDGQYHIVTFIRNQQNATFQLDQQPKLYKRPKGRQLKTLNSQWRILVGGEIESNDNDERVKRHSQPSIQRPFIGQLSKRQSQPSIQRPFIGQLSGLNFNGLRVLDMSYKQSANVKTVGNADVVYPNPKSNLMDLDIRQESSTGLDPRPPPGFNQYYQTSGLTSRMMAASSSLKPESDDLIGSGVPEGSGCAEDDLDSDDECVIEDPSPTDLITPVVTRSTPPIRKVTSIPPLAKTTPKTQYEYEVDVDYDDVIVGSGQPMIEEETPLVIDIDENEEEEDTLGFRRPFARYPPKNAPTAPAVKSTVKSADPAKGKPDPDSRKLHIKEDAVLVKIVKEVKGDDGETKIIEESGFPERNRVDARILGEGHKMPKTTLAPLTFKPLIDPGKDAPPAPRPTLTTDNAVAPVNQAKGKTGDEPFPRTGLIAGVSISLIVIIIVVVFLVFKCYNRTKTTDSFSMDDGGGVQTTVTAADVGKGQYQTFYNDSNVTPSPPTITTTVTQVNGFNKGKKKKDFKEWYV